MTRRLMTDTNALQHQRKRLRGDGRCLRIVHFNDVYNVQASAQGDVCGGAARPACLGIGFSRLLLAAYVGLSCCRRRLRGIVFTVCVREAPRHDRQHL